MSFWRLKKEKYRLKIFYFIWKTSLPLVFSSSTSAPGHLLSHIKKKKKIKNLAQILHKTKYFCYHPIKIKSKNPTNQTKTNKQENTHTPFILPPEKSPQNLRKTNKGEKNKKNQEVEQQTKPKMACISLVCYQRLFAILSKR